MKTNLLISTLVLISCGNPTLEFRDTGTNASSFSTSPVSSEPEEDRTPEIIRFEKARKILAAHCFKCHGVDSQIKDFESLNEEGFLTTLSNRNRTPLVVAGKPFESEIYRRLKGINPDGEMPRGDKNRPLTQDEADVLKIWIEGISEENEE